MLGSVNPGAIRGAAAAARSEDAFSTKSLWLRAQAHVPAAEVHPLTSLVLLQLPQFTVWLSHATTSAVHRQASSEASRSATLERR